MDAGTYACTGVAEGVVGEGEDEAEGLEGGDFVCVCRGDCTSSSFALRLEGGHSCVGSEGGHPAGFLRKYILNLT